MTRLTFTLMVAAAVLLFPGPAAAVQHHGGMEGLVAHEIGHLLFVAGLLIFLVWIRRYHERGWPAFRASLLFLLAWNLLTASGHVLYELRAGAGLVRAGGRVTGLRVESVLDLYFYLTRLDHFLLLPAMAFLLLALRQWRRAAGVVRGPEMTPDTRRGPRGGGP